MGGLFSKKKSSESRVTEQDKAVLELKKQRDQLKQYQKNILTNLEKERELARKLLLEGKKDRAKLLLKKKRFQESILEKSEKQLDNIDEMCHSLEFAQIEIKVLDGLKSGNEALKKVHDMMSIDDIEKILEETREGVDKQNEIDALLSGSLSPEDLEEVETELEKIMEEENIQMPKDVPLSPAESEALSLPEVPETPLPEIQEKERPIKDGKKVLVPAS
ncbi:charged multivesicular body protein 6-A [Folsomia candida]|uniref:Charged multivesicular body protein 6 n=1 Tax=Folsomia candida TaxID=158441 RepID=A0A226EQ35_FOLCA|nr:charged multivesicular body protein 6-A [Folsomia candida]OXA59735.1 Charged multivesicular body protein 6 [Folsomia candida]